MSNTLRLPFAAASNEATAPPSRPALAGLPGLADELEAQVAELAALTDARAALLVGQSAIARFGPVPALLRHTLQAARQLLEDAEAASALHPGGPATGIAKSVSLYLDALLDTAVPVAGASAPLFLQVVLALFARRRWARAAALLEAALARGHSTVPEAWVRASLARAYANTGQSERARAALRAGPSLRT